MFYIVALGNPGEKYTATRHNVGWQALDACRQTWGFSGLVAIKDYAGRVTKGVLGGESVQVLYPDTFMNHSGSAVVKFVPTNQIDHLIVVHDDIDVPFGDVRVAYGRGAGGNKGVASIIEKVGSKQFVRVRIGIAPKSIWTGQVKRPAAGGPLERFVLKPFTSGERKALPDIYETVRAVLETIVTDGHAVAMNRYN